MLQFRKATILIAFILHKDLVSNFHKARAVGSRMRFTIFCNVLFILTKIIENFGIWTTRIANWRSLDPTAAAPPVFVVVIEEDMFTFFNPSLGTLFCCADFSYFCINTGFFKDSLPNFCRLGIFWNTIFLITNETSNVNFFRVKTDNLR